MGRHTSRTTGVEIMVKCKCGGDLRKLKYTWLDDHTLHKKTVCNTCGLINEWDKIYTDPKMANRRFFHEKYTKGTYQIKFGTPESKLGNPMPKHLPKNYGAIADGL